MINLFIILFAGQLEDSILKNWQDEKMLVSYEVMQSLPLATLSEKPARPPLNEKKVFFELLGGFGLGISTGVGTFYLCTNQLKGEEPLDGMIGVILGGIGYILGSALGVFIVGNIGDETGNWTVTFLGSVGGVFTLMCPVGAAIGFNMTRKYKTNEKTGGSMIDSKEKLSIELVRINF